MLRKLVICLVVFFSSAEIKAQYSVIGIITDSAHVPIPYAAVALLRASDSVIVKGALTDNYGKFVFDTIKKDEYVVKVAAVGYSIQYSSVIVVNEAESHPKINLVLRTHGTTLGVINVSADKPFVEHKVDRSVYNIGSDDLMTGRNGVEVLQNLPGIMAPDDQDISVAGKKGTMILIDGRPTYLTGQDINEYLKTIDASQIERIEVITNPSAKYDAAGGAVINIILKKDAKLGAHGNISATDRQAYYNTQNLSLNGSYRTKRWNIYGNGGVNTTHTYGTSQQTRDFTSITPEQLFDENSNSGNKGESYSGRVGADFMPDDKNTIGVSANAYYSGYSGFNNNYISVFNQSMYADSGTSTITTNNSSNSHKSAYIDYTYKIDSTGKELSASAGYNVLNDMPGQEKSIYYYDSTNEFLRSPSYFTIATPVAVATESAQADCVLPVTKSAKFEAGIKAVSKETDDNIEYWDNEQGIEVVDTTKSNHFNFTESIFLGYSRYLGKLSKKINYSIGVRVENTEDKGVQYVHDSTFTRNYTDLFPNGNINWNMDSNSSLYLYYREGITRPAYNQLNPFLQYTTPYSYVGGNTDLQPSLYYNYGLSYSFKSLFGATFEYSHTTNGIQYVWEQNTVSRISYDLPLNMTTSDSYFLFLNSYVHLSKWWTLMSYYNMFYSTYTGSFEGNNYNSSGFSWYIYCTNTFTITKQWKGEMNVYYSAPTVYGFNTSQTWYSLSAAISKKIAKERGVIRAGGSNIITPFNAFTQNIPGVIVHSSSNWYPQTMYVSLSWKLGKIKQG